MGWTSESMRLEQMFRSVWHCNGGMLLLSFLREIARFLGSRTAGPEATRIYPSCLSLSSLLLPLTTFPAYL
ncbi:hypothetical protein BDQ12DRAFT_682378 [Crucibulum laeve]|uniref:Uncharacterized protein n=1 Tax=Crucibulum laeve TaxID=68775 RepID=A0A5C3MDJ0_9AGAR|nr:hypothetical protein BDQ12DRAFT_682378 [Crucibulum laeve]